MASFILPEIRNGRVEVPKIHVGWIISTVLISSLSFVTALQWQNAFYESLISLKERHKVKLSKLSLEYISASIVTVVVILFVIMIYYMLRGTKVVRNMKNTQTHVSF